jgi:hypothetical protein
MLVKIIQGPNKGRTFHSYGGKFLPLANVGLGRVSMDVLIQRSSTKGVGGYTADINIESLEPRDDEAKVLFAKLYAEQEAHRANMKETV